VFCFRCIIVNTLHKGDKKDDDDDDDDDNNNNNNNNNITSAATYHSKEQRMLLLAAKFNNSPISEAFNCGHHITVYVTVPTLLTLLVFEQTVGWHSHLSYFTSSSVQELGHFMTRSFQYPCERRALSVVQGIVCRPVFILGVLPTG
jgi:hypothetical protein